MPHEIVLGPAPLPPVELPADHADAYVRIVVLPSAREFGLPRQATPGSAGFDLIAVNDAVLHPFRPCLIMTGLKVAVPPGFELQVRPRSGLSLNDNLMVANSPGTVDSDYRGEVGVILTYISSNTYGPRTYTVKRGMKIAQAVVARVPTVKLFEVESLEETERGAGGFGSSGRTA